MSSPSKLITTIDDLPPEMINELFKHLPLKDLVACSLVNKRWHSIYAAFKRHRIVATLYDPDLGRWKYPAKQILDSELCSQHSLYCLVDPEINPHCKMLSNLKHLALWCWGNHFYPELLKSFKHLVHLEIGPDYLSSFRGKNEKVRLKFPKLEVLVFHSSKILNDYNDFCPISIDCPKLHTLAYGEQQSKSLLSVKHPKRIRVLETNMFGPKLTPFNVHCLVTRELNVISKATLLSLPVLKELHFNLGIRELFWNSQEKIGTLDRVKRALNLFLDGVDALRGPEFKFTFAGFRLTKTTLDEIGDFEMQVVVNEYGHDYERVFNEDIYMKNYHLIEPDALEFINELYYNLLRSVEPGELPDSFFDKFAWVETVHAREAVEDARHLRWFLKSLRSLKKLDLRDSQLGQEFYDQLPTFVGSLTELTTKARVGGLQLNFEFIRELPRLNWLDVYDCSSFPSLITLVTLLSELKNVKHTLNFEFEEQAISVCKWYRSGDWEVSENEQMELQTEDLSELIDYLRKWYAEAEDV